MASFSERRQSCSQGCRLSYLAFMKATASQAENVPVPPLAVLASLPLPGPLPDVEADEPDGEAEDEKEDDPLDLLPDEEPLLDEPLPEPDREPLPDWDSGAEPLAEPEAFVAAEPLWAVWFAGRSLWTHTPSASSVFVPGMWMAAVRVGASIRTTDSISSSFICSSIRKSPGWMNSADANPHSSPRRIMKGCSGVALM